MIKVAEPFVGEEEAAAVREVLLSGRYVSGAKVRQFEEQWASYIGVKHAVAVNSGTSALHLLLAGLGITTGDEVLTTPLTFFSTVSSILYQQAFPVFADLDPDTYCLSAEDAARRITPRTKAILAVHIHGQAADMAGLNALAQQHGIPLLEDCAQAHGTAINSQRVGSLGRAGAFSFFATKAMTTGEGGMITTDDPELAEYCRLARSHGMSDRDTHVLLGYNYRMTEMEAAMGSVQLTKLEELNQKRRDNSLYLIDNLSGLDWLAPPVLKPEVVHSFFWAAFRVREDVLGASTAQMVNKLREAGIEVRHRYNEPLYRQPVLASLAAQWKQSLGIAPSQDYGQLRLPVVESTAGTLIGLPNHAGLSKSELDRVVEVVKGI